MADDIDQIVDNLKQPSSWMRVLFMVGFAILLYVIIAPVIFILMLVQALFLLFTGESNGNLKQLGAALAQYVLQILLFISYNTKTKPFPFTDFPGADTDSDINSDTDSDRMYGASYSTNEGASPAKPGPYGKKKTATRKKSSKKTSDHQSASGNGDADSE